MTDGEQTTGQIAASEDALWDFASERYGAPGVAEACLAAQDAHGVDVNLLLYAAWLASLGASLDEACVHGAMAACRPWREGVILPLRAQRRAWRDVSERAEDYAAIKALEIDAEREQLRRLAAITPSPQLAPSTTGRDQLLAANLAAVARAHDLVPETLASLRRVLS